MMQGGKPRCAFVAEVNVTYSPLEPVLICRSATEKEAASRAEALYSRGEGGGGVVRAVK